MLAQSSASAPILAQADQTNGAGWFNGDDAVVLRKGTTVLDVIGQIGTDPGTEWGTGLTSTADNTIRRKATIQAGDPNGGDAFDPAAEWNGFATDTFDGLGAHQFSPGDQPPEVSATTPVSGAANVAVGANVSITFSEPVDVSGAWFSISCGSSGSHSATAGGGPTTYTLDPASDFAPNETCTVTVFAGQVTDQDVDDPPDTMASNYVWSFSTVAPHAAPIHEIQGAAHLSPSNGQSSRACPASSPREALERLLDAGPDARTRTTRPRRASSSSRRPRRRSPSATRSRSAARVAGVPARAARRPTNLTTTELTSPTVTVVSTGNPLPAPTVDRHRRPHPADRR